jgi:hypothetical protein
MITATPTHADRLAEAAAITAKARSHVDDHAALAAEVDRLKTLAGEGELDDTGAGDFVKKAEALRISEIVLPRKQAALRDALAAEVAVALDVLAELAAKVDVLVADAATVADALSGVLVDPAAQAVRGDTSAGHERDTGRCMVEAYFPGVFPAAVLAERIRGASTVTWGNSHVPAAAMAIVQSFDSDAKAIRDSIDGLRAVHKAAVKAFG